MIDCPCGFGREIDESQKTCPVCRMDITSLHLLAALPADLYSTGMALGKSGDTDRALGLLMASAALDEGCAPVYAAIGHLLLDKGLCSEAARHYEKAIELDPSNESLKEALRKTQEANSGTDSRALSRRLALYKGLSLVLLLLVCGLGIATYLAARKPAAVPSPGASISSPAEISRKLSDSPSLRNLSIAVDESGGKIRLSGVVPTPAHGELASEIAGRAAGTSVISDLEVSKADDAQLEKYTVQKGDTLTSIAGRVYGDSRKWERIFEANRGSIARAHDLRTGQMLMIPKARPD